MSNTKQCIEIKFMEVQSIMKQMLSVATERANYLGFSFSFLALNLYDQCFIILVFHIMILFDILWLPFFVFSVELHNS